MSFVIVLVWRCLFFVVCRLSGVQVVNMVQVVRVSRVVRVVHVVRGVQGVHVVHVVQVVRVVRIISLDYMHSEDIWFSWCKLSNYR